MGRRPVYLTAGVLTGIAVLFAVAWPMLLGFIALAAARGSGLLVARDR